MQSHTVYKGRYIIPLLNIHYFYIWENGKSLEDVLGRRLLFTSIVQAQRYIDILEAK